MAAGVRRWVGIYPPLALLIDITYNKQGIQILNMGLYKCLTIAPVVEG